MKVGDQRYLVLRPDGMVLATASAWLDSMLSLWNVETGEKILQFKAHRRVIPSLCFSPDGKTLATGGDDHTIKLWDLSMID